MSNNDKLIYLGVVTKAHGIKGDVCIRTLTENPINITKVALQDEKGDKVSLKLVRVMPEFIICHIEGISDRNAAELMRGTKLYAPRSALPEPSESEYYIEDMKNLEVQDIDGLLLGKIFDVHNFGAGDIIEIIFIDGESEMYPFTKELPEINSEYVAFTGQRQFGAYL